MDIHPQAKFGKGILMDHGTGIVIGQTAEIGNNVSILQNVTLGGALSSKLTIDFRQVGWLFKLEPVLVTSNEVDERIIAIGIGRGSRNHVAIAIDGWFPAA